MNIKEPCTTIVQRKALATVCSSMVSCKSVNPYGCYFLQFAQGLLTNHMDTLSCEIKADDVASVSVVR